MYFSEYPYAGMDFWGDPDLALPAGERWGALGNILTTSLFMFFIYIVFSYFIVSRLIQNLCVFTPLPPLSYWPIVHLHLIVYPFLKNNCEG